MRDSLNELARNPRDIGYGIDALGFEADIDFPEVPPRLLARDNWRKIRTRGLEASRLDPAS